MNAIVMNRLLIGGLVFTVIACDSTAPSTRTPTPQPAAVAATVGNPPATAAAPAPPTIPVGMADPFGRLNGAGVKAVDDGWKALRAKRYGEAREAFHAVVAAYPDKPAARFQELRSAVLENDFASVPAMWRELLARDFVGYARRLDRGKEMAALRASPQWTQIVSIRSERRRAYSAGLEKGVVFVARTHASAEPEFMAESGEAKLDLNQEVYHYDPVSRRIRRLSDSDGQVVAIHPDTDYRQVIVLTAGKLRKVAGGTAFSRPGVTVIGLDTLEPVGPFVIEAEVTSVDICFSPRGEPVWNVTAAGAGEARPLTLDATATGLVALEEGCVDTVATTSVDPAGVEHFRPDPEGVALSEDGLQLSGVDGDRPLRAREPIRPGSFSWSPGRKRFVYTGSIDQCRPSTNSLFVWDGGHKKALRLTSAVASYETQWLDDNHLAYESGGTRTPRLTIHDFSGGEPVTLKVPAGAGLFGVPTLACDKEIQALGL